MLGGHLQLLKDGGGSAAVEAVQPVQAALVGPGVRAIGRR
jgi:hypothetical protein